MLYLAAGIVLFVSFLFLLKGLASTEPEKIRKAYKTTMIVLGVIFIFLFIRVGMPFVATAIAALIAAIPYFGKIIQLLYTFKFLRKFLEEFKRSPAASPAQNQAKMSPEQAREILGVSISATNQEINEAYKRLMKKNHPDTGGSKYFASQLNEAKDILLRK